MLKSLLYNLEDIACTLLLMIMLVIVIASVIWRYILNNPIMIADELSRYALIWMCFLGSAAVLKRNGHIRVGIIDKYLSRSLRRIQAIITVSIILAIIIIMIVYGYYLAEMSYIIKSSILQIRQAYLYAIIPISGLIMLLRIRSWLPEIFK